MSNSVNLAVVIGMHALSRPHAVALIDDGRLVSYAMLAAAIRSAAAALQSAGVGPGDRVGVSMAQTGEHLVTLLALARLGAVSLPLHPSRQPAARRALCTRYGVGLVVVDRPGLALDGVAAITFDADTFRQPVNPATVPARGGGASVWRLDLTSGTTAIPKAIPSTHERTLRAAWIYESLPATRAPERFASFMDLNINSGVVPCVRQLVLGKTVVFVREQRADAFFDAVDRYGATATQTAPAFLDVLARAVEGALPRCPGLEAVYAVGGMMTPAQQARFAARLTPNIYARYGSTETGAIALASPAELARHPHSIGRLVPWVQAEVVDEEGRPLPTDREGLLRFRGEAMADGYLDDPEATARVFRDGWVNLGDMGSISADGRLTLAGRSDDMINIGGTKVSLESVEAAVSGHPAVRDAAAFSLQGPQGEARLCVAVVADPGVDGPSLIEALRPRLRLRTPRRIFVVDAIPRNPSGKVMRSELARRFGGERASPADPRDSAPEGDANE